LEGNDLLIGGAGDTLIGGIGDDRFLLPASIGSGVRPTIDEKAGGGDDILLSGLADLDLDGFANVENLQLVGGTGLIGRGTTGTNRLTGSLGNDTLFGEGGNDTLDGSSGRDSLIGGGGDDTYILEEDGSLDSVVEGAGAGEGRDTVCSGLSVNLSLYPNVENVLLVDRPGATPGVSIASDNNAIGSSADNLLTGNTGNNRLDGLAGSDTLIGGGGNDTLIGGGGNDTLTGGAGADRFRFATALNATTNRDMISDFSIAQGDTIELENAVFTALTTTGPLAASSFLIGTAATSGSQRLLYNGSTGLLAYDSDGNGAAAAVAFAMLTPGLVLTSSPFTVA
jgi:Ca2+-binding RTX toxin-like protein